MSVVYGKALLVIKRLEPERERYEVTAFLQSASGGEYASDSAHQDFELLGSGALPLPSAVYGLGVGETVRVYVVYEFLYTCDYWGEWDVRLHYKKERVLRRQRARKVYIPKAERSLQ
jgi:hypothetical protein